MIFSLVRNSSIAQYANRSYKDGTKQAKINRNKHLVEMKLSHELVSRVNSLSTLIPTV